MSIEHIKSIDAVVIQVYTDENGKDRVAIFQKGTCDNQPCKLDFKKGNEAEALKFFEALAALVGMEVSKI